MHGDGAIALTMTQIRAWCASKSNFMLPALIGATAFSFVQLPPFGPGITDFLRVRLLHLARLGY